MSNVDVITGVYEAFGRGDVPTVLGAMDPQIHWYEAEGNPFMPSGEPWIGPDAVLNELFVKLGDVFEGFAVHPHTYHDAGDVVVVEARYKGKSNQNGMELDTQVCHLWTLADGKITKFQQYVNTAELQAAMGAA